MLKLSFVLEAIDRATVPVRKLNRLINQITAPVRRVRASLADLGREAGIPRLASAVGDVRRRFSGLAGDLRAVRNGLFFVAAAAVAAFYPLKRTLDKTGELKDTAETLGLTVRQMQRLSYVFTLDGSSMQDAALSLQFLQRNAVQALTGSEEMATWFRRAGISAEFLRKNLKDPKALLGALADGVQRLRTPAARLALLQALLGRSSARLVIALAKGSKGLEQFGDEAESVGAVLDDAAIESIDRADKSITRMQQSLGGVLGLITAGAAPVIEEISQEVLEWVKANRELIKTEAAKFFKELRENLPAIWKNIKKVTAALFDIIGAIHRVVKFFGGWDNVLKAIAVLITAKVLVSLAQLAFAIKGISVLLLTTPFGLLLTGLAALAVLGLAVYNKWNPALSVFQNLKNILEDTILLLDELTPKWARFVNPFAAGVNKTAERIRNARATVAGMAPVNTGAILGERAAESVMLKKNPIAVGGSLHIKIDTARELRSSVFKLKTDNNDVPLDVSFGPVTAVPR